MYIYIFGPMITGHLLIGLGIALVYRKIQKTVTAVQSPQKLSDMIDGVGRAVSTQTVVINRNTENILEKLSALQSWHRQGIFAQRSAAHWIFSFFRTLLCKPWRWLCMKIPVDQQFLKYSDQLVWDQQPCSTMFKVT